MNKILLIIKREYLTRIRKRTFIISTILFPLFYVLIIFGSGYLASKSIRKLKVAVIDSSGLFTPSLVEKVNAKDSSSYLTLITSNQDSLKQNYSSLGYDGYVVIPAVKWDEKIDRLPFKTNKTHGIASVMEVQNKLNIAWGKIKADSLGMDERKRDILNESNISLKEENVKNKDANAKTATTIAYVCGILIYIIMLLYGSQVMMGVMEEKTSRIAEVVISSVRPFQLMLGKIVGIGLVALTQFLIWIACMLIIYNVGKASGSATGMMGSLAGGLQDVFTSINMPVLIFFFIFYLLGGFFFYSSLYAAIGSAVNEDMREAQYYVKCYY
jgi:ABC-2 type transport system permease protein